MKKYLFLALVSLLFPLVASAITPTPGRYHGTAVDFNRHLHWKIRFHLSGDGHITDFHINGQHLQVNPQGTAGEQGIDKLHEHHHNFNFDTNNHGTHYRYIGHGQWEGNHVVRGDFRIYDILLSGGHTNTYFTWEAKLEHHH